MSLRIQGNKKRDAPPLPTVHPNVIGLNMKIDKYFVDNKKQDLKKAENRVELSQYDIALGLSANYQFNLNYLVLKFKKESASFRLVSLTGSYDFAGLPIKQSDFVELSSVSTISQLLSLSTLSQRTFVLRVGNIERHALQKKFKFTFAFRLSNEFESRLHTIVYEIEIPYFRTETKPFFKFLDHFHAADVIIDLFNSNFNESGNNLLLSWNGYDRKKNDKDPADMMRYALNIEDLTSQDEFKEFSMKNVVLNGNNGNYNFYTKKLPPDCEQMTLCIVQMRNFVEGKINYPRICLFVPIADVKQKIIFFEKRGGKYDPFYLNAEIGSKYFIRFVPNRICFRACLRAIEQMQENGLEDFFEHFEESTVHADLRSPQIFSEMKFSNFNWINPNIASNIEQKQAITNIVNCTAFPFPYIAFGPPGTGKTSCLVECIAQILSVKPTNRIIVTAQSNSACDEIGDRLLKFVSSSKIFRFYSPSLLKKSKTSEKLREISNLRNDKIEIPTEEELGHFKVIISTLVNCSRLIQMGADKLKFDYIFVDEASAATEPESYIPIMSFGTSANEITSNIVLLGDHKQLGPVVKSEMAKHLGLGLSLMERMMSKPRYSKNLFTETFNEKYVTRLLDNFRSHPAILHLSNVLFYDAKLRAKASEPDRSFGTGWKFLPNKNFPVMFHCCKTKSCVDEGSTSSYNENEVQMVRAYVDELLTNGVRGSKVSEQDIGIVSPYSAQLSKLKKNLCDHPEIEMGTAEYYQGREKKIIIMSTVKSKCSVGFLKDEKRLNVCLTRAKSLMVVIGNADTLQQDTRWKNFLYYCKANGACTGMKFDLGAMTEDESIVQAELNRLLDEKPETKGKSAGSQDLLLLRIQKLSIS